MWQVSGRMKGGTCVKARVCGRIGRGGWALGCLAGWYSQVRCTRVLPGALHARVGT